jgi:hydroxybutyrate-dimer hydrolase
MSKPSLLRATLSGVALSLLVTGCFDTVNRKPSFVPGDVLRVDYDGITDDLLTAGLGQTGLASAVPPALQDPENPTAAELRRLAIYNNYRAIVDTAPGGGYGTLFGPGVGAADPEGLVAGREYLAYADDGTGKDNVVLMVQVPASFDPARACIVAAPSSGSRGIYGAIGSAGEWGLKKGCAVAYTDKGTGMGVHDLTAHVASTITGEQQPADTLGTLSHFTAIDDEATRHAFLQTSPHRVAFKHAHSARNPEKDWGVHVLQSIELAFYVLNLEENYGRRAKDGRVFQTIYPEDTLVIASSVSNGGGASIRAAEIDAGRLIDGVAVSEPNVNPPSVPELVIRQGNVSWDAGAHSRPLLVYTALLNVLAPCAVLAPSMQGAPLAITPANLGTNRCEALHTKGVLQADTAETQAIEALDKLHQAGMLDDSDLLLPSHHALSVYESVGFTYTSAYGRFGVTDAVCGFSFAGLDASTLTPAPVPSTEFAKLFGTSNGVPPSGAVYLFNDHSVGGPLVSRYSVSLSTQKQDQNLDGALCMLALATGQSETGASLTGAAADHSDRVREGMGQVRTTGKLGGVPTVIVHGRNDALLPVNHTSRGYYGANKLLEGEASPVRYYEVTNAQHLDVLNGLADFGARYVPLHHYFNQAMDLMWEHLTVGAALPESQVVRTTARGKDGSGALLPLTPSHLPAIASAPSEADRITLVGTALEVPATGATPMMLRGRAPLGASSLAQAQEVAARIGATLMVK